MDAYTPENRGLIPRLITADGLASGRIDVAMARANIEPFLGLEGDLIRTHVASQPLTCLIRADHPAARVPLTLDAFLALPHVAVTWNGETDPVDAALQGAGARRVAVTVASFPAAAWFVGASDMIAVLPENVAAQATRRLALVTRPPPMQLPPSRSYLWWHARFQHDPGHAWWRGLLIDAFKAS